MHSLSVCFGPAATIWNLLFNDKDKAREFYESYTELRAKGSIKGTWSARDDFGQNVTLEVGIIHAMLLEDLDQSQLGQVERALHNARAQAKAQELALTDPVISQSIRKQQMGPAVMTPFGGNRMS